MADPLAWYDDLMQNVLPTPGAAPLAARAGKPTLPPLSPEEENSLLSQLSSKAMGGLGYVGSSLGKAFGGRAIRGLLGGQPHEALSVLPFSDTLGITDPHDEVSGEDLLKKAGLLEGEGQKGQFELRDLAGPALEIGLDPATYLSFGSSALTKAGGVAKKIGVLPKSYVGRMTGTLGDVLAKTPALTSAAEHAASAAGHTLPELSSMPLGGLASFGLPFTGEGAVMGTGPTAQRIGGALDKAKDWVKATAPVRYGRSLFDPSVMGATSEIGQKAGEQAFEGLQKGHATARGKQLDVLKTLEESGQLGEGDTLRKVLEGTASPLPGTGLERASQQIGGDLAGMQQAAQNLGIHDLPLADDFVKYAPRYRTVLDKETRGYAGYGRRQLPTGHPSLEGREDILRNLAGGTGDINEMVKDPRLRAAPTDLAAAQQLRSGYGLMDDTELGNLRQARQAGTLTPADEQRLAHLTDRFQQSEKLANWVRTQDPQYAEKGLDFFGNHPVTDYGQRALYHEKAAASANAIHDLLANSAEVGQASPGAVPLTDVLKQAGLDFEVAGAGRGGLTTQLQRLQAQGKLPPGASLQDLQRVTVPAQVASEATRYTRALSSPEGLEPFLKVFDQITNLTKAGQTALFPLSGATQVRNGIAGLFLNWVTGAHDPALGSANPLAYVKPYLDMQTLRSGGVLKGANKIGGLEHLTEAQATRTLAEEMWQHGVTDKSLFSEVIGQGEHAAQKSLPRLPGEAAESLADIVKSAVPTSPETANPLNVAGVASNRDLFAPVAASRQLGEMTHELNAGAGYIARRKQGFAPEVAAAAAKASQYSTDVLTPFERSVMRRAVPFYSWMRHVLPTTLEQIAAQPGGRMAIATKLGGRMGQQDGFLPDWLKSGVAIPMGTEENGNQRYLSHLGLPIEDTFGDLDFGPGGLQRTAMGLAGQTNPLIKGPLELATGKQLYSGRDLADLHSVTGSVPLEQALMNSPLSRAFTSARTLFDDRKDPLTKAVNLGTGLKLSDVDMDKARALSARDLIEESLHDPAIRRYTELSVRPEDLASLSPDQLQMLRLNRALEKQGQDQAKAKKRIGVRANP